MGQKISRKQIHGSKITKSSISPPLRSKKKDRRSPHHYTSPHPQNPLLSPFLRSVKPTERGQKQKEQNMTITTNLSTFRNSALS